MSKNGNNQNQIKPKLIRVEPAQYWPVKNRKGGEYKQEVDRFNHFNGWPI